MRRNVILFAMTIILMGHAPGASAGEFEGAGIQLCSFYIESYKSDPSTTSNVYFSWAEGFMSGLNVARLNDTTAFKSMTAEQQEAHIRDFCDKNPDQKYFKAVIDLYTTIYPKQKT